MNGLSLSKPILLLRDNQLFVYNSPDFEYTSRDTLCLSRKWMYVYVHILYVLYSSPFYATSRILYSLICTSIFFSCVLKFIWYQLIKKLSCSFYIITDHFIVWLYLASSLPITFRLSSSFSVISNVSISLFMVHFTVAL